MSAIDNLLRVMADLRHPDDGCPWDIRQTSRSIAGCTLDETHEVIDAIERDDTENLKEELGDLLFNIVFHARIAEEQGQFDFDDVAQGIADKMTRRHPHVFGEGRGQDRDPETLAQNWQRIKAEEKAGRRSAQPGVDALDTSDDSANSAMFQARELQQKAAELGFDWHDVNSVFDKLEEELAETREAFASGDKAQIAAEIGDLLFVCVNLARHAKVNAEMSLRQTNRKFQRRFAYVREHMRAAGIEMTQDQLEQMEVFWQEAKHRVDEGS